MRLAKTVAHVPNGTLGYAYAREHAHLRDLALLTEELLDQLARDCLERTDEARAHEARERLDDFDRCLRDHFAAEEREGYLDAALAGSPRLSRVGERLRREHGEFRTHMQVVLQATDGRAWVRAHGVFVDLRRALRDHERAEEVLLQSAYLDDLGGSG